MGEVEGRMMARETEHRIHVEPMTLEERQQLRAALERADRIREQLLWARGGRRFPPASEDIAAIREERERELP